MVKVAIGQFESTLDVQGNLDKITSQIREAGANGAKLIAFHELATTPYFCFQNRNAEWFKTAETIPGPSSDSITAVVEETGVSVMFPQYELVGEKRYNTVVLIEPGIGIVGKYRKSHVPASKAHGKQGGAEENWYFSPGDTGFVAFNSITGLKIGTLICYDRHHPEGQRAYGLLGIDILFVPTASYRSFITGPIWEAELMSAAFQNSYYVAGINKVGAVDFLEEPHRYPGRSLFIDPEGQVLVKADDQAGIIYCEIDPEKPSKVREPLNFFKFRRPDLYESLTRENK